MVPEEPDEGTTETAPAVPASLTELERGRSIDRYVVIERIGKGGMGLVYKAYDPELDRSVAIKVLRAARTDHARARLLREAQALARLDHPNVVAVHDAGTFDGEVFLATELVDGATLREWLRARTRTRREIVGVFLAAGEGLAAAHRAGLVHRDIKPDNVMVGRDGRARVLDFGLARAAADPADVVDEDSPSVSGSRLDTPLTRAGAIMGTPRYMAPEQLAGGEVDARTDQYAFCLTLWEALAGEHPFGQTAEERRERAREGRLPPPRGLLTRRLRGVLARGLSVVADARYPSMDALLGELRRDPVRRARIGLGVALIVLSIALAALAGRRAAEGAAPCQDARGRLAGIWDEPRRAALTAAFTRTAVPFASEASHQATVALDRWSDAWVAMHTESCAATAIRHEQSAELLDLRMACLAGRRRDLAAVVELLVAADADVVTRAVDLVDDLPDLAACADATALRAAFPAPTDPTARADLEAAEDALARATALVGAGKYKDAGEPADAALAGARAVGHWPTIAASLILLSKLDDLLGKPEEAAAAAREAVGAAARSRVDELDAHAWIQLVHEVGDLQARAAEIDPWLPVARAVVERSGSAALVAELDETLAAMNWRRGRYDEALADAGRARAFYDRAYGPDDRRSRGTLWVIANVTDERGRHDEALPIYQHILDVDRRDLGDHHPVVAQDHINLATAKLGAGRDAEALEGFERGLAIFEAVAPRTISVSAVVTNIGTVHTRAGRHELAAASYRRALEIIESVYGPDHPDVAHASFNHADTLVAQGKLDDAHRAVGRSLAIWTAAYGPDHPYLAYAELEMARILLHEHRAADARTHAARALVVTEAQLGAEHEMAMECRITLGEIALAQGRRADALAELTRARTLGEQIHGPSSHDLVDTLIALGRAQSGADARATLERAVTLAADGGTPPEVARASLALASSLWPDPASRPRARALAERAHAAVTGPGIGTTALGTEIEHWLAAHP